MGYYTNFTYLTPHYGWLQHTPPPHEAPVCGQSLSVIRYNTETITLYCMLRRQECDHRWSQPTEAVCWKEPAETEVLEPHWEPSPSYLTDFLSHHSIWLHYPTNCNAYYIQMNITCVQSKYAAKHHNINPGKGAQNHMLLSNTLECI